MNSKYFGNALDLFKFDLLTYLASADTLDILYVGMITKPQPKELDPKYLTYEIGNKNKELKMFLEERFKKDSKSDVHEIVQYFQDMNINFRMFTENGLTTESFQDKIRESYFDSVLKQHGYAEKANHYLL